jgi:hypothetical protein
LGKILTEESDFLGKSKVRPTPQEDHETSLDSKESFTASPTPTWGRSKEENHEQRLQKWIDTPIRPPTNTTRPPHQDESTKTRSETGDNKAYKRNPDKVNREARDDEIEFTRIPIAGEDSKDYDVDYETEEEDDEVTATLPIVFPIPCSTPPPNLPINDGSINLNAYIADEIAFRVGPLSLLNEIDRVGKKKVDELIRSRHLRMKLIISSSLGQAWLINHPSCRMDTSTHFVLFTETLNDLDQLVIDAIDRFMTGGMTHEHDAFANLTPREMRAKRREKERQNPTNQSYGQDKDTARQFDQSEGENNNAVDRTSNECQRTINHPLLTIYQQAPSLCP